MARPISQTRSRRRSHRRGTAMVEAVIVLSVFVPVFIIAFYYSGASRTSLKATGIARGNALTVAHDEMGPPGTGACAGDILSANDIKGTGVATIGGPPTAEYHLAMGQSGSLATPDPSPFTGSPAGISAQMVVPCRKGQPAMTPVDSIDHAVDEANRLGDRLQRP